MKSPPKGPDVQLAAQVLVELGEHLDAADRHAASYARSYARAVVYGERCPQKPPGLHPQLAKLVRELVLDARVSDRWCA